MKETVKTSRTAGYLEKIFRTLNQDWFNGELEEPIITIQSTPRTYGHVTVAKVWQRKGDARHELNIDAGTLERPIENLVATVIHEMVHLYNIAHNVQDCSRSGSYHNRRFKQEAERRGLVIGHDEKYGWTRTEPSDELIEYILANDWTEINMSRFPGVSFTGLGGGSSATGATGGSATPRGRTSSTRKYVCPCCHQSVRATKMVNIICGDCNEKMMEI